MKQHLKNPLYRNSIFLITGQAVATGLGFFFWMMVARYYTEYEVGIGVAIISAVCFLGLLSTFGLKVAIVRFLPKSEKPVELINSCLTLCGVIALVISNCARGLGLALDKSKHCLENVALSSIY